MASISIELTHYSSETNFDDVERARQNFLQEKRKYNKKILKLALIISGVYFAMGLLTNTPDKFQPNAATPNRITYLGYVAELFVMALIFGLVIAWFCLGYSKKTHLDEAYLTYKHAYKEYFIWRQLSHTFTNLLYAHNAMLDSTTLTATNLIDAGDKDLYRSNDFVMGEYRGAKFVQADVTMGKKLKNRRGKTYYTYNIFKGRFQVFTFPKQFKYQMTIVSRKIRKAPYIKKLPKSREIETESNDFNREFIVNATNGSETFYILNPSFMENLLKLSEKHDHKLYICFLDNTMFISVNDKNDFYEPPANLKVPLDEKTELAKVNGEMQTIIDIITSLKLTK